MMGWYGYDGGWGWMTLMMLGWLALPALGVWALVVLTRNPNNGSRDPETSRQILDRRLAAGEIDQDEYLAKRRLLEGRAIRNTSPGDTAHGTM